MLHDTADDREEVLDNPYADSLGDAGIQSAQMLIERNVDAVITGGIGRNALRVLTAAGVQTYKCRGQKISQAVLQIVDNKLESLESAQDMVRRRLRERRRRRLRGEN